jgi:hypothetical protein
MGRFAVVASLILAVILCLQFASHAESSVIKRDNRLSAIQNIIALQMAEEPDSVAQQRLKDRLSPKLKIAIVAPIGGPSEIPDMPPPLPAMPPNRAENKGLTKDELLLKNADAFLNAPRVESPEDEEIASGKAARDAARRGLLTRAADLEFPQVPENAHFIKSQTNEPTLASLGVSAEASVTPILRGVKGLRKYSVDGKLFKASNALNEASRVKLGVFRYHTNKAKSIHTTTSTVVDADAIVKPVNLDEDMP